MSIQITAVYASLLAILYIVLSYRVAQRRMRFQVGLGTGQNTELERAVRIHGNFAEYVPIALLLLAFLETGGGPAWAVHVAGSERADPECPSAGAGATGRSRGGRRRDSGVLCMGGSRRANVSIRPVESVFSPGP